MPQTLYPLLLLACPVGMGLMIWLMMRGGSPGPRRNQSSAVSVGLDELRSEVAELHAAAKKEVHQPLRPDAGP